MSIINDPTSSPSFGSPTILPKENKVAYWWTANSETEVRVHDFETDEIDTISIESDIFSPEGWEEIHWIADRFLIQSRPNLYWLDREGSITEFSLEDNYTRIIDIDSDARRYLYVYYPEGVGVSEEPWTLRIYDSETDAKTVLTEHPEQARHAGFSPDGQWVAFRENPTETFGEGQIVIVDTEGNREQAFHVGEPSSRTRLYGWHPDGQRLFLDDRSTGWYRVGLYDWRSDEATWFGSGEYNELPMTILPEGDRIITLRFQNGLSVPIVHTVDGTDLERELELTDGLVDRRTRPDIGVTVAPDQVLLKYETATRPARLLTYDLSTDEVTTIVDTQTDTLTKVDLVQAEHVTYDSTDGKTVNAVLHRAPQSPSPAFVKVHGGPTQAVYRGFDSEAQFLAKKGYTVLQPNYRGSTDQDRAFEEAIRGESGGRAVDDVAEGGRWLAEKDWINANCLAVYGHSAGAYNAAMQTIRYPDRWQVAVPKNGFLNRVESLRNPNQYTLRHIIKDPEIETQKDYLRERSPVHRTEDVNCPVCIIQGENDPGLEMSEDFVDGLEERGWTEGDQFRFEIIENEGHVIGDKERLWNLIIDIFDEYLSDQ